MNHTPSPHLSDSGKQAGGGLLCSLGLGSDRGVRSPDSLTHTPSPTEGTPSSSPPLLLSPGLGGLGFGSLGAMGEAAGADWESREELRLRELEEARARAAQMEKTMRWWSDCTANWREKWSKVRAERNRARDEVRQLRQRLDTLTKELTGIRRERQELASENETLRQETLRLHGDHALRGSSITDLLSHNKKTKTEQPNQKKPEGANVTNTSKVQRRKPECVILRDFLLDTCSTYSLNFIENVPHFRFSHSLVHMTFNVFILQLNLLKEMHQDELGRISEDLEDELGARTSMDKKLAELRAEMERLQVENAAEWGRRERLETEKLGLERDNKKLRAQVEDLEEQLAKQRRQAASALDSDLKVIQTELFERNKVGGAFCVLTSLSSFLFLACSSTVSSLTQHSCQVEIPPQM
uniref:Coiled-coil domain containing 102A n=1 Tax=Neolamprologus brichardi TaxID=32507 RepID=A0A3Q4G5H7_NEOBR